MTIGADLVLIPLWEIEGAAVASSIAYTVALVATMYWYRRESGRGVAEALLWRPSDIGYYTAALKRALGQRTGDEASGAETLSQDEPDEDG